MWLSKRITRNIKQNTRVWKFFNVVFLSPIINHIWELLQAEFKFLSVVSRHFSRSRAFLAKEIFNPVIQSNASFTLLNLALAGLAGLEQCNPIIYTLKGN